MHALIIASYSGAKAPGSLRNGFANLGRDTDAHVLHGGGSELKEASKGLHGNFVYGMDKLKHCIFEFKY